jgi:hypothetical protein
LGSGAKAANNHSHYDTAHCADFDPVLSLNSVQEGSGVPLGEEISEEFNQEKDFR